MTTIQVGDKAPDFSGIIEDGSSVQLSDYKGSKLILFFYPRDNTPGCTAAACNLNDNFKELTDKGFKMLGVSPDTAKKHTNFIEKFGYQFSLLADTEQETLKAYEVWGPKKFMGKESIGVHRTTFVIDENGVIEHVFKKVKTKDHTAQILAAYK